MMLFLETVAEILLILGCFEKSARRINGRGSGGMTHTSQQNVWIVIGKSKKILIYFSMNRFC